jgi:hypothetical protein
MLSFVASRPALWQPNREERIAKSTLTLSTDCRQPVSAFHSFGANYVRYLNRFSQFNCVLLKPTGNRFTYNVNMRELSDASIVEVGFIEFDGQ